ncbi:MAG: methionine adenosyltransferase domain-containing protein [Patescibacteria group bacterium]
MKTSEAVTPKHPDKICDRISDKILDEVLKQDENSRVAVEAMGGHSKVTVMGELTTNADINVPQIVKDITGENYEIETNITTQSNEIANGVDSGGAGDQGIMVGYACNENEAMIPHEAYLAKDLCKFIYDKYSVDGKTQITINDDNEIVDVVASFMTVSSDELGEIVDQWIKNKRRTKDFKKHMNPAGDWSTGGFDADSGLTGRKIVVDGYGPRVPVGGGAFSGKDATKVDRSGAYMARKKAIELLKEEDAKEVVVKVAYAIGKAEPVMLSATIDGQLVDLEADKKEFTPKNIIESLELKRPFFEETAKWGPFGNGFIWDKN